MTASVSDTELLLSGVLLQLVVVVAAGRLAGTLAARAGQARVVGEILVGVVLGPSLFGALAPGWFAQVFQSVSPLPLTIMSQLGLILLMFEIGMEFDFSLLAQPAHRRATAWVASLGILCPFVLGGVFGYATAGVLAPGVGAGIFAAFLATAFSITALPVLGRILLEFELTHAPIGVVAISAAAINDVVGWLLLAVVTAWATANFSAGGFALTLVALAAYIAACWLFVRPLLTRAVRRDLRSGQGPSRGLTALVLAVLFVSALATYRIGIFAIFGGFMVGVLLHGERMFVRGWNQQAGALVHVLFMPIFFTLTGLRTHLGSLDTAAAWGWCALLIALATAGKFGGCYLAGRWSGLSAPASRILGVLMNARGLMELIVINVGYDIGVLSPQMFTMLVLMALVSNVVPAPALRRWLPRLRAADLSGPALLAVLLLLAPARAWAAPDFSKSTILAAPESPREAEVVTFTVVLRNTGPDDAGAVYFSVGWPVMGFLVDVTGLDGAEIDHEARTATLTLPLAAGADHRVEVRVLAPRDSGGDTLTLAIRASHFASGTEWWDRTSLTIDTRVGQGGVLIGGLRVAPAGLATLAVLGAGAGLWLLLRWRGRRAPAGGALAARLGPGPAAAAITIALGFWTLFGVMAWRDYRSLTVWPETTCTVLGGRLSAVATTRSGTSPATGQARPDDTSYVPVLGLVYDVDGRRTYSSGYDTGSRLGIGGQGGRREELARWTVGATTPCWYDPADPLDVAVLRGFGGAYLFALFPMPVFLLGVWGARRLLAG